MINPLSISLFKPLPDQRPEKKNCDTPSDFALSWPELALALGNPKRGTFKEARGAWSPARFSVPKRANANVVQVCCLVFDVDAKGLSFDAAVAALGHYSAIIHTSWSHGIKGECYRAVLECTRPILPHEYADVWNWGERLIPGVDGACKDLARFWWLPVQREGFRCVVNAGSRVDVDLVLEMEALRKSLEKPRNVEPVGASGGELRERVTSGDRAYWLSRAEKWLDEIPGSVAGRGEAPRAAFWVCMNMTRGFDLSVDDVLPALVKWGKKGTHSDGSPYPWTEKELRAVAIDAEKKGQMPRGKKRTEAKFTAPKSEAA